MDINEPVALILVAVVTVAGSYLTNRAANKTNKTASESTLRGMVETSRAAAEEQAYNRAKAFYEGVIDRQDREISGLEGDVSTLKDRVRELQDEVDGLTAELETAKNALRLRYPDEP